MVAGEVDVFGCDLEPATMPRAEIGGDIRQIVHGRDVDPGVGHRDHHIGAPEPQPFDDLDLHWPGLGCLVDQILAGDAQIDGAPDQFARDLGGREEPHGHLRHRRHLAQIGPRSAGPLDGQPRTGEQVHRLFLQPPLGGESQHDIAHRATSASSRSTQSAHPTEGTSPSAPRRRSRRSYWPPEPEPSSLARSSRM